MDIDLSYDKFFKILILGDSLVGKSSILIRYTEETFYENRFGILGIDFKIQFINIRDNKVKMQIWDTAGQERFGTISKPFYKNAAGIILVYDISNKESFKNVNNWFNEINNNISPEVAHQKILVGNKSDLEDKREVSFQEGSDYAESKSMKFFETSAKNGNNISVVFIKLCSDLLPESQTEDERKELRNTNEFKNKTNI